MFLYKLVLLIVMIPGLNSRQAQEMMRKMGIKQEEIEANEVIIRVSDKEIIILNPKVSKVNMMGHEMFQISGRVEEKPLSTQPEISEEDIKIVVEQTGVSEKEAREAIKKNNNDLAQTIMDLKKGSANSLKLHGGNTLRAFGEG